MELKLLLIFFDSSFIENLIFDFKSCIIKFILDRRKICNIGDLAKIFDIHNTASNELREV